MSGMSRPAFPGWVLFLCSALQIFSDESAKPLTTVAINLARDRIMVPATLNGSNGLSFMLDTGFSMTMVHPELPEQLNLRRAGEITVIGIAGDEKAPTYEGARFEIGGQKYQPRRVGALTSDANRRRRRDGIIGSGLFRQFVVELDFARKEMALYSPTNYRYAGPGEIVPLRFRRTTPIVAATIHSTGGAAIADEFEIDTGCDSGLCLGQPFIQKHGLLKEEETRGGGKFGVGGSTAARSGFLPGLQLGRLTIPKPQTDFFLEGSPVDHDFAGHIGFGVLKQFKVVFDYSRKQMILERPTAR
jgi:predicted aspartyl protease